MFEEIIEKNFGEKLRIDLLDGEFVEHKKQVYGICRGYYTVIVPGKDYYWIKINAHSAEDKNNVELYTFLAEKQRGNQVISDFSMAKRYFWVTLDVSYFAEDVSRSVSQMLGLLVSYLEEHGYESGCEACGTTQRSISCYDINGMCHHACDVCLKNTEASLEKSKETLQSKKSNFLGGMAGAFLGSLIGIILWCSIFDEYKFIFGLVICWGAFKGYELLGGRMDRRGVIISVAFTVVSVFLANRISWIYEMGYMFELSGYGLVDSFLYLEPLLVEMGELEFYLRDLVVAYAVLVIMKYEEVIKKYHASGGDYKIEKL